MKLLIILGGITGSEEEDGSFPAKDNGFSQYLLSLRAAIHPSDKWAIGHLKMCLFYLDESEFDSILKESEMVFMNMVLQVL